MQKPELAQRVYREDRKGCDKSEQAGNSLRRCLLTAQKRSLFNMPEDNHSAKSKAINPRIMHYTRLPYKFVISGLYINLRR